jgi:hypothetical protein
MLHFSFRLNLFYSYVFLNFEPAHDWHLREAAFHAACKVTAYVKGHLTKLTNGIVCIT